MAEMIIYITLGRGRIVGIGTNEHLVVQGPDGQVDLGLATQAKFEEIAGYLAQLRVHAVKVGEPRLWPAGEAEGD